MVGGKGVLHHPWQDCVKEFGAKTQKEQKTIESKKEKKQDIAVPFFSSLPFRGISPTSFVVHCKRDQI